MVTPKARILIVEDEEVIRRILATILEDAGHLVAEASDAAEARALLQSQPPYDLLLVDKNLPGESGLDLIAHVRAATPDAATILVTGYAGYDSAVAALRLGVSDYLEKPFLDLGAILKRVEQVLARRGTEPAAMARALWKLLQARQAGADVVEAARALAEKLG